jgi:hypothetical protein
MILRCTNFQISQIVSLEKLERIKELYWIILLMGIEDDVILMKWCVWVLRKHKHELLLGCDVMLGMYLGNLKILVYVYLHERVITMYGYTSDLI